VIGALLFVAAPTSILTKRLGAFLLGSVAYRHTRLGRRLRVSQRGFVWVGAALGFFSALLGTVGLLARVPELPLIIEAVLIVSGLQLLLA
jgi:hypothetical protein